MQIQTSKESKLDKKETRIKYWSKRNNFWNKIFIRKILSHGGLIILCIIFAAPFLWMLSTSLKTPQELFAFPPNIIPKVIRLDNYYKAFMEIPFLRYTFNTLFIAIATVFGVVFSAPLVAYSCSLINWRGKNIVFVLILATFMLPYQVTMIPVYVIFNHLQLTGTYWPLILPAFTSAGYGFYVFLMRQFFMTIPVSLISAAKIDGASELRIYLQIVLPLCKPALTAIGIFTFLSSWSDFLGPLLYLNSQKTYTLTLGLYAFTQEHYVEWEKLMAASVMFTIPIIILFFFSQKQFIEGISITGIKG